MCEKMEEILLIQTRVGEENCSSTSEFFCWSDNQIDIKRINKRKKFNFVHKEPQRYETQGQAGHEAYIPP